MFKTILAAAAAFGVSGPAYAITTFTYTATVDSVHDYAGVFGGVELGDFVSLKFEYDYSINPVKRLRSGNESLVHTGNAPNSPITSAVATIGGVDYPVGPISSRLFL